MWFTLKFIDVMKPIPLIQKERIMYVSQDLGIATLVLFFSNMLISEVHFEPVTKIN